MELKIVRDPKPDHTPGELWLNGKFFCYTLEDVDHKLESGGRKVYGETCIPRGKYPMVLDFSARFKVVMPHVLGVPQFDGIRIHAGNTTADTHGCPLVGDKRVGNTVQGSRVAFARLMAVLEPASKREKITLEVV
jgi:hypothetical protein